MNHEAADQASVLLAKSLYGGETRTVCAEKRAQPHYSACTTAYPSAPAGVLDVALDAWRLVLRPRKRMRGCVAPRLSRPPCVRGHSRRRACSARQRPQLSHAFHGIRLSYAVGHLPRVGQEVSLVALT